HGEEPDGRHVLSLGVAGRGAVRRGRRQHRPGRHPLHRRGDEADERDRSRCRRDDQGDPRREWTAGGVRAAAVLDRLDETTRTLAALAAPRGGASVAWGGPARLDMASRGTDKLFDKVLIAN